MQSVHVELAIRYWSQFRNFSTFTIIVISHHPTYRLAWIQEHALIAYFQAPLNFPYITRILQFKSTGLRIQSSRKQIVPAVSLGQRLFLRLRRRLRTLGSVPDTHAFLYQAWSTIFDLASESKRSYDAARTIRSGTVHDWQVYALFRLCKHLEEPQRSKVKHIITSALKFRNLTVPQVNKPFTTPFLAHDFFQFRTTTMAPQLYSDLQRVCHSSSPPSSDSPRKLFSYSTIFSSQPPASGKALGCFQYFHLYHVAVVSFSDYKIHPLIKFETMDIAVFHWTKWIFHHIWNIFAIAIWIPLFSLHGNHFGSGAKLNFSNGVTDTASLLLAFKNSESFVQKQWEYHKQEIHRQRRFTFHDLQNLKRMASSRFRSSPWRPWTIQTDGFLSTIVFPGLP